MKPDSSNIKHQISNMQSPLVVIVGPTASGKSSVAMELARQFHGEIISADSRTIYRGMDIGTAKPSAHDQSEIPHHLLDVISPSEAFSAAEFKRRANIWIDDIAIRGRVPILVGGTGLYIDSVIYDYAFLPPPESHELREQLQALSVEELQSRLKSQGIPLPENNQNPRHLIRAIETNGAVAVKKGLRDNTLVIGIDRTKEELTSSIKSRIQSMVSLGLEAEVNLLVSKYGWDCPGLRAVGYQEWQHANSPKAACEEIKKNTLRYAKRQRTWFKRNPHITWIKKVTEARQLVQKFLQDQS